MHQILGSKGQGHGGVNALSGLVVVTLAEAQ